jgi:hypothetical protein
MKPRRTENRTALGKWPLRLIKVLCYGVRHPACYFRPPSKKVRHSSLQPSRSNNTIRTIHTHKTISLSFLLVNFQSLSPEAAGHAQVNQTLFVPCSRSHFCFHSWIHNQFHRLECARLPTTKFIWKFAAERWKLIKIPHQILLKWLTRTMTST